MTLKKVMIERVIEIEGGYVNNPHDPGGETNYGITKEVAQRYGYYGAMRTLPREIAEQIYADRYWDPLYLDEIVKLSPSIAEELFDSGVNVGIYRAAEWLQRSLNALNNMARHYDDIRVDGQIGRITFGAFKAYMDRRGKDGETVMLNALNSLQGAHYISLAERRQTFESFLYGWLLNRVGYAGDIMVESKNV